jgi:uncharacterized surface protein with fasciclin (FAS1) repeats
MKNIIDTAIAHGDFGTLAKALTAADLVEVLEGMGPFTVFAPTDKAFAKIKKETLDAVLADKEKLLRILRYHVLAGKRLSADIAKLTTVTTLEGSDVKIDTTYKIKINDALVIGADIECSNGVIHIIDTVLMPK